MKIKIYTFYIYLNAIYMCILFYNFKNEIKCTMNRRMREE